MKDQTLAQVLDFYTKEDIMEPLLFLLVLLGTLTPVSSLENVALGKSATQSGTHRQQPLRWGADNAVDGDTNPDADNGHSCAVPDTKSTDAPTRYKDGPAWWRVDLGQEMDVYQIKIYNANEAQARLSNTWVLVADDEVIGANDATICHDIIDGAQDIVTVSCNYKNQLYKRGRYVTLWRQADGVDPHYLNFCEIEVFSCPAGTWGMNLPDGFPDCVRKCPGSCQNGGSCSVSDGTCPSGCADGFWDRSCDQECHCEGAAPCDIITGNCGKSGCEAGYIPDKYGKCVTGTDPSQSPDHESPDHSAAITGLTVVVAVVAVVNVVLVVVVVLLYRRITNNGTKSVKDDMPLGPTLPKQQGIQPTPGINPGFCEEDKEYETLRD